MGKRRGRGEGGMEELPSGKWRATRSNGTDADGKPLRERKTFDSKAAALTWLRQALTEKRGEWASKTLAEWFDHWLAVKAQNVEPGTHKWYHQHYKNILPALGGIRLGDLKPVQVQGWLTSMSDAGVTARSRHGALKVLRAGLQEAVRMEQLARNVASSARSPKVKKSIMVCLTADEARRLLEAVRAHRYRALFDLALDSGMRPGELLALHWPEVDLTGGVIAVEKSLENLRGVLRLKDVKTDASRRRIPISPRTVASLRDHHRRMSREGKDTTFGPVFIGKRGGFLQSQKIADLVLRPILLAAALPKIRFYDLRHTSATLLLTQDVNIKVVSERLGHADIAITLRHYVHSLPGMQQKAVGAMIQLFGDLPTESPTDNP